jgi:Mitochondrial K+-H+ exchange-related
MDVFLVPAGRDQYELYTEEVDEVDDAPVRPPPTGGFFSRMRQRAVGLFENLKHRFHKVLAEAERERRRGNAVREHDGRYARAKGVVMRWIAESVAEQRLLWNLRRADRATFMFPNDMVPADAVAVLRKQLGKDFDKHRFWLAIDSLLMVGSAALIVIPGPNALGYFFAFRVVGHFFSVRGARRGLDVVEWDNVPSAPLTDLRRALDLDPVTRLEWAERVASTLHLDHLPSFFQRIVLRST